jgi:hypothetical protein
MKFFIVKDHVRNYKFYFNNLVWRSFKFGYGAQFASYLGTNAETPCVEFCILFKVIYLCKLINLLTNYVAPEPPGSSLYI